MPASRFTPSPLSRRLAGISLVLALAMPLSGCGYNDFQRLDEATKASWSEVLNQYQRRADLIPNIVATVKGEANFEQETLTKVIEARAKATSVQLSADDLTDPAKMAQFSAAQENLSQSLAGLGRLLVNVERYPELKSITNYQMLQSQLEGQENRIRVSIRDYNNAVQSYNTTIRTFPDAIGAKIFYGAKPMVPFQATTPGAETAPPVDFGNGN